LNIKDLDLIANINTSIDSVVNANFLEIHNVVCKEEINPLELELNMAYNYSFIVVDQENSLLNLQTKIQNTILTI